MTIILPEGTVDTWQAAHQAANIGQWNDLATDLLHCAAEEKDYAVRGDILTLALVASQHAFDLLPSLDLDDVALEMAQLEGERI
jgi:hypothetical protein